MVYITRKVDFCASHRLYNPEFTDEKNDRIYGRCNNPNGHGHNYELEVTLRGSVDPETGMVMDLKALKTLLVQEIIDKVDHKNLNVDVDFLAGVIPTAENIVVSFWQILEKRLPRNCELHEMKLWESADNMAYYRGEGAELARHGELAASAATGK
ncbi:MAG: 6-carboxytetrahydropterin synthase [Candidatus Sumerlaeaceae bacterium]|nr:6-carboxytetrahydropterin synthase [Candidatus Sumerlaeaceae bacterium]